MGPIIVITPDIIEHNGRRRSAAARAYGAAVRAAGGVPVIADPAEGEGLIGEIDGLIGMADGFVLSGGDDPATEPFGEPTHPAARRVDPARQAFETALLRRLREVEPDRPVLGVCLGMQMMALVAGGRLDQHMPETTPTHALHWEAEHAIEVCVPGGVGVVGLGVVHSMHRQAVADPGGLRVIARASDGVIEAVDDPGRRFYVGVQWHPERSGGDGVIAALVAASRG